MELTSNDLDKFQKPMTFADFLRILRSETLKESPTARALFQAVLIDGGVTASLRQEIERELPHATDDELHVMSLALLDHRTKKLKSDEPESP